MASISMKMLASRSPSKNYSGNFFIFLLGVVVHPFHVFCIVWTLGVVVSALTSHMRDAVVVTLGKFLYTNCLC